MAKITGAEALIQCLLAEGVRYVFGIPGDQCCPITDAIYRLGHKQGLEFITTRHEQAAANMADAWARVSGGPGVCLGTVGPGVVDLAPGVYPAWADSVPMIVLGAQNQTWRIYPEQGSMQSLDQTQLMKPITKWQATAFEARRVPQLVQTAFREATAGRPRPVYLELPSNVLLDSVDTEEYPILKPEQYRAFHPPLADPELVEQAAARLVDAEWPLIHVGSGVLRSGAWQELIDLAEYLGATVTTSIGARGAIPEDHPLCLIPSSYGSMGAQASADLVLLVGGRMADLDFWGRPPAWGEVGQQQWIQIDIDPRNIGLNRPVDLALVGDARLTLKALLVEVKKMSEPKTVNGQYVDAMQIQESWLQSWEEGATSQTEPIHPLRLMREARQFYPREAICAVDGGNTPVWAFYQNRIYAPRSFLWPADSGHLGTGVPYAIAAKLARPELPVYCITGDGAFGFNAMEMETAKRTGAPVQVIIANDGGWGMVRGGQKAGYGRRYIGADFCDAHYDELAKALGCYGERVTDPQEITPALQRAKDSRLPAVLDVVIDREANMNPPDLEILDGLWMEGCEGGG